MNASDFIKHLKDKLQRELPGPKAHEKLLPIGRSAEIPKEAAKKARKSAVAFVLFYEKEWKSILIQRPEYEGHHSGQVCLPGGQCDKADKTAIDTALRECEEETGIPKSKLELVGQLSPVFIPVSNFLIEPFIFYLPKLVAFTPDPREVQEIFEFELKKDLRDNKIDYTEIVLAQNKSLPNVPYYPIKEKVVWGATALILAEFQEILKNK